MRVSFCLQMIAAMVLNIFMILLMIAVAIVMTIVLLFTEPFLSSYRLGGCETTANGLNLFLFCFIIIL